MTRGVQQGEENVRRLRAYLKGLETAQRCLPSRDGRPNLSAIADACGFDRGVFYANQTAKLLLDEAYRNLGLEEATVAAPTAFDQARLREETKARADVRSKALEEEVLRLRAENAKLREENERFRALRRLLADTGRIP
ncbi:DUF6262 family protein [Mesorhizobium sp. VK25A]|uniref:DUF6262 family protein n=1 Tax=Mesorhizobium vachelliae TaxID=3072309 RepID=A0ABU5AC06_9HYPH|nr:MULTISPECIES: DUF6262 family protein [unclassified Mesorhizobium]MDX8449862.1 DUF6262 family protein [Mesorhizobium sp. VK3C]MDX8535248.1 DUF6262 family protein [Mesorhizobium sp. VK25D]MDX8548081.1 DUF6262 family protein [Mesorhizobium sp. VK25A]TGS85092.1 hypothetical protein EN818_21725 [Mesorhizobium sp. M3A.F.Ca.ET.175.01.1.1]TGT23080.1 hypothetical protein EN817_23640 [Mesorhizobium sp. M3A.F.Ca.ET.174.01.1.1]